MNKRRKLLLKRARKQRAHNWPSELRAIKVLKKRKVYQHFHWQYVHESNNRIFDFYDPKKKIAIEIDGSQHDHEYDTKRDKFYFEVFQIKVFRVKAFDDLELIRIVELYQKEKKREKKEKSDTAKNKGISYEKRPCKEIILTRCEPYTKQDFLNEHARQRFLKMKNRKAGRYNAKYNATLRGPVPSRRNNGRVLRRRNNKTLRIYNGEVVGEMPS